jgi:probable HAF family extracellular repeat protein
MKKITFLICCLLIFCYIPNISFAIEYEITNLHMLGGDYSHAYSINNQGQVVGAYATPYYDAFFWDSDNGMTLIAPFGYVSAGGYDINNSGQVVGVSGGAFIWSINSGKKYLSNMYGASGINDTGQVVGVGPAECCGHHHAYLWDNGTYKDLGALYDGYNSIAYSINNSGLVVGESEKYSSTNAIYHAFIWDSTNGMQDLYTLPGDDFSRAYDINDSGQVVGESLSPNTHAFIWEQGIGMYDIGHLGGGNASARGINNLGQVVGTSDGHAFIWDNVNGMRDLNDFLPANSGWTLVGAEDINDQGQIVGYGFINGGNHTRAFLLTPTVVPEPVSSLLFVIGGSICVARRLLKRKKDV